MDIGAKRRTVSAFEPIASLLRALQLNKKN